MTSSIILSALLATATLAAERPARDAREQRGDSQPYPERARRAGQQGSAVVTVALDREGYATAREMTRSSGYERLGQCCGLILDRADLKGRSRFRRAQDQRRYQSIVEWRRPNGDFTGKPPNGAPCRGRWAARGGIEFRHSGEGRNP